MNKAIVIGFDAVNALGLVQSLGREGVYVIAVLECEKSELIKHSKYAKEIYSVNNVEEAIELLIHKFANESSPIPVFAAGDGVAMALDKNYDKLSKYFLFEHAYGKYSIEQLMDKELQVSVAKEFQFSVPVSVCIHAPFSVPQPMIYPCIVKPLVSCIGNKHDIVIAEDEKQLHDILTHKTFNTEDLLIQQYIQRDYEYCMIGCSQKNGGVSMPLALRPVAFSHFLQDASTVQYVEPLSDEIFPEVVKIKELMNAIKYVGLFSVEFMHDMKNGKIYFTEINFRNDGTNSFITQNGTNLPYLHYLDLLNLPPKTYSIIQKPKKVIWEGIHFSALIHHDISLKKWLTELKGTEGFLYYFKDDKAPFYFSFINKIKRIPILSSKR